VLAGIAGLWVAWNQENPLVRIPDPVRHPPPIARILMDHPLPPGTRFWSDSAAKVYPYFQIHPAAKVQQRVSAMHFNQPCLWGIRTVQGFSPLEPAAMKTFRDPLSGLSDSMPLETLIPLLRLSAVSRIYTTAARAEALHNGGLEIQTLATWPSPDGPAFVLLATYPPPLAAWASGSEDLSLQRNRPDRIQIRRNASGADVLRVSETFATGWEATNPEGLPLSVRADPNGFIAIDTPEGVRDIRLQYHIPGWQAGWLCCVAGLLWILWCYRKAHRA
jgi:hypothetical protein